MNNNRILENWLRQLSDDELYGGAGISRSDIAGAGKTKLEAWVNAMSGDPEKIIADHHENDDAQKKLDAMREIFGGGSVDPDQVKDIVDDVVNTDVKPAIDEISEKVDQLAPLTETLDRIANVMAGKTSNPLPIGAAIDSGNNPIL